MASGSNWLGFSLSQQEHHPPPPPRHPTQHPDLTADRDCLNLAAGNHSAATLGFPNLTPDGTFGILEDWNAKSVDFKGSSSELSMVVGSRQNNVKSPEPKLEDFLGGISFSGHAQELPPGCKSMTWTFDNTGDYVFSNYSLHIPAPPPPAVAAEVSVSDVGDGCHNGSNCSIGLSMIKTWLRTQPAPPGTGGGGGIASALAANAQSLSLSMSTGSRSSPSLRPQATVETGGGGGGGESSSSAEDKSSSAGGGGDCQNNSTEVGPRRSVDTFGHRTSIYRGVTRHRWTGRYEAHLWDNSCRREGQTRKGRQVYLGGYDKEEKAARAYDLAALKYWGSATTTNFPISNYEKELEEMRQMTRQEYVASLRRKSSGFSRGASIYRGVTRHHQQGRWQARIGRVAGNKDLYLGTFSTQEEAAEAYDIAAIKFRGLNAVTNFDMNRYDVKSIMESNTLPIGVAAKRLKEDPAISTRRSNEDDNATFLAGGVNGIYGPYNHAWPAIPFHPPLQPAVVNYSYGHLQGWCKQDQDLHHSHSGGAAHRFLPPPFHTAVSLESSSMDNSSGSGNTIYGSGSDGFLPEHELVVPPAGPYSCRNVYNLSEQTPNGADGYERGGESNGFMINSVHAAPQRPGSATVCYGPPIFSVWNDA